jgi:putative SOS response-associated peptidase YedK
MCGRYRLSRHAEVLAIYYAEYEGLDWNARFNIAPTQSVPVIRQDAHAAIRRASFMRWGLIPSWAKDKSVGTGMINARAETAADKPAFKEALLSRRCLIPADGFYEWKTDGKVKRPYCFEMCERQPFAFAGLWDCWRSSNGTSLETCTILTTTPNRLLADIHDRMPAILSPANYDSWLSAELRDTRAVMEMVKPFDAETMRRYPVSERVNSTANDDAECSKPIELTPPAQAALF